MQASKHRPAAPMLVLALSFSSFVSSFCRQAHLVKLCPEDCGREGGATNELQLCRSTIASDRHLHLRWQLTSISTTRTKTMCCASLMPVPSS